MKTLISVLLFVLSLGSLVAQGPPQVENKAGTKGSVAPASVAIIPFDLVDNLIVLKVQVNGSKPFTFVLDNGAGICVIDPVVAKSMDLKTGEADQTTGAGAGKVDVIYVHDIGFELPGAKLTVPKVGLIDLSGLKGSLGITVDGLLGYDFFERYVVEVDYDARVLRLFDPETYIYSGSGESIPVVIRKNHIWF